MAPAIRPVAADSLVEGAPLAILCTRASSNGAKLNADKELSASMSKMYRGKNPIEKAVAQKIAIGLPTRNEFRRKKYTPKAEVAWRTASNGMTASADPW